MKVILRDYSSASSKDTEATNNGSTLLLDRLAYRVLGNRTANKKLVVPTSIQSDVDRLLLDLENLYSTSTPNADLVALDKYLGALGVTLEYPFISETYSSPQWLSGLSQEPFRNVINGADNVLDIGREIVHKTGG